MRLFKKAAFLVSALALLATGVHFASSATPVETQADSTTSYPRNGQSGTMLYVNGQSKYFNTNEADLAIYCWNSNGGAWSGKTSARLYGDLLPIAFPKQGDTSVTWSYFKICRYNPSMNPLVYGQDGVYNETEAISIGNLMYAQNTFLITGYGDGNRINYQVSTSNQYGIGAEKHVYLDLSSFPSWEEGNAKFGIYFARPSFGWADGWGSSHITDNSYEVSFCWKVEGQDNPHLYEAIVPTGSALWSMAIAVRFDPVATSPSWNNVWNQTQDLGFNADNQNANVIEVLDWNRGEFEATPISMESRVNFYGSYFLNTVTCSGTGAYDATTAAMWTKVADEYQYHLSRIFAGEVWKATASETGSLVEQAVARYDEIVFAKKYNHADFMNRAASDGRVVSLGALSTPVMDKKGSLMFVLLGLFAFLGSVLSFAFFFRKKRASK